MSSKITPVPNENVRPAFQLQYSVTTDRWKFPKPWRWFVTIVVFSFMLCNGMNFNVLSGAIYCVEQLENDTKYDGREDLPTYLKEKAIRSSLFGAYNWITPLIILPTLLLCEYGGAEYVFLGARLVQGCLEFITPNVFPKWYILVAAIRAVQGRSGMRTPIDLYCFIMSQILHLKTSSSSFFLIFKLIC